MQKTTFFFTQLVLFLFACSLSAQTKLISYKSHSGNMKYFEESIIDNSFNTNYSNLGAMPERFVIDSKLDSVIIIDDKKSVIVTSRTCKNRAYNTTEKWKPGRDTVYSHPIFSNENIDSVKNVLKKQYHFKNNMDSTVFLKYDKKTKTYKTISPKKVIKKAEASNFSKEKIMYYLVISIALFVAIIVYKKRS